MAEFDLKELLSIAETRIKEEEREVILKKLKYVILGRQQARSALKKAEQQVSNTKKSIERAENKITQIQNGNWEILEKIDIKKIEENLKNNGYVVFEEKETESQ